MAQYKEHSTLGMKLGSFFCIHQIEDTLDIIPMHIGLFFIRFVCRSVVSMISPSFDGVKWIKSISPKAPTEENKKSEFDTQFVFLSLLVLLESLALTQRTSIADASQKVEHIEMKYSLLRQVMLNIYRCGEQKMPSTESGQKA